MVLCTVRYHLSPSRNHKKLCIGKKMSLQILNVGCEIKRVGRVEKNPLREFDLKVLAPDQYLFSLNMTRLAAGFEHAFAKHVPSLPRIRLTSKVPMAKKRRPFLPAHMGLFGIGVLVRVFPRYSHQDFPSLGAISTALGSWR
jgi:hypothetical protein